MRESTEREGKNGPMCANYDNGAAARKGWIGKRGFWENWSTILQDDKVRSYLLPGIKLDFGWARTK